MKPMRWAASSKSTRAMKKLVSSRLDRLNAVANVIGVWSRHVERSRIYKRCNSGSNNEGELFPLISETRGLLCALVRSHSAHAAHSSRRHAGWHTWRSPSRTPASTLGRYYIIHSEKHRHSFDGRLDHLSFHSQRLDHVHL